MAYNYDQLGAVSYALEQNSVAESYFRDALKHDPKVGTSWFGLAKIYKGENRLPEALKALDQAGQIDSRSASVHYLRAQILTELGRKGEAKAEMAAVRQLKTASLDKLEQEVTGAKYHDPQLTQ